jgi:hypothetical protein
MEAPFGSSPTMGWNKVIEQVRPSLVINALRAQWYGFFYMKSISNDEIQLVGFTFVDET